MWCEWMSSHLQRKNWTPADQAPYQFLFPIITFKTSGTKNPIFSTIFCWQLQQAPGMSWWQVKTDIKSQAFQNAAYIYRVLCCQAVGEFAGSVFDKSAIWPGWTGADWKDLQGCVSRQGWVHGLHELRRAALWWLSPNVAFTVCVGFSVVEVTMLLCQLQKLVKPSTGQERREEMGSASY